MAITIDGTNESLLSDPNEHNFVPKAGAESVCHYCRRPANEHRDATKREPRAAGADGREGADR